MGSNFRKRRGARAKRAVSEPAPCTLLPAVVVVVVVVAHAPLTPNTRDPSLSQAVDDIFKGMIEWQTTEEARAGSLEGAEEESEEAMIVKCLQLMSEGHFKPNQHIMLSQPHNEQEVCLLENMVQYLGVTSKISTASGTDGASGVAELVLEVLQGPCEDNQE